MGLKSANVMVGVIGNITQGMREVLGQILNRLKGSVDLRGKLILFDNDELLLAWENSLREQRIVKEKDTWKRLERELGEGNPKVSEAFLKWQEQLYAYIETDKDRFLRKRTGAKDALDALVKSGAKTIVVTKGAKPYTQKCFDLLDLSSAITHIYSPAPGKRDKRFGDAVRDHGKNTSRKCLRDTIVVGHDPEKDMAWELVPEQTGHNDGRAPVFIMFDTFKFDRDVDAPMNALTEIVALLAKLGKGDFHQGFKAIEKPEKAVTKGYTFKTTLYHSPKNSDKAAIPTVYDIKRRIVPLRKKKA